MKSTTLERERRQHWESRRLFILVAVILFLQFFLTAPTASAQTQLRSRLKKIGPAYALILDNTLVTDEELQQLDAQLFLNVVKVSLRDTKISSSGIRALRQLPNLRILDASGTRVGDEGLAFLKNVTSLRELYLQGTTVSDIGLYHLKDLTLRTINLEGTKVSDRGLRYLKDMPELSELHLGNTMISDEGIISLRGRPLRRMDLRLTVVSDAAIPYLTSFPLEELIVWDTHITDQGLRTLKKALPALKLNGRD